MNATGTTITTQEATRSLDEALEVVPRHSVALHDDDVHSMDFVALALLTRVEALDEASATRVTLRAHNTGSAAVKICPLERAEAFRSRLQAFGLGVTIERA